jgi:hypothetical protein
MLWKGQTFNQIVSKMKKNKCAIEGINKFLPSPKKHYRREIDTEDNCARATTSLADFFRPGATIVNSTSGAGIHTVDINLTNNSCEKPVANNCSVAAQDARRRVRSGARVTNQRCYTSTQQYLEKRNLGFDYNNYRNIRTGDSTFMPGIPSTLQNIYLPNCVNRSPKVYISGHRYVKNPIPEEPPLIDEPPLFKYRWVNGQEYSIHVDDGYYNLEELNIAFYNQLSENKHYLIDLKTGNMKIFFMKFVYDTHSKKIQIQCNGMDSQMYSNNKYEPWTSYLTTVDWNIPEYTLIPNIILLENDFLNIIGFENAGYYPSEKISETEPFTQPETNPDPINNTYIGNPRYFVFGERESLIKPKFEPLNYKPNNTAFGVQGAVSASSVVTRLKYNTITGAATQYTRPFGRDVANSLAYNVPAPGYSIKYVEGYGPGCIPTVKQGHLTEVSFCPNNKMRGG